MPAAVHQVGAHRLAAHGPEQRPDARHAQLDAISASLKRFGQAEPLVVQKRTGRVIGGNGRLQAMKQLGWTQCEIVELDLDDLQATSLSIALNRTGELAGWDEPALAKLLEALRAEDSLEGVGYSTDDIDALVQQLRDQEQIDKDLIDDGAEAPPAVAVAKTGDLWCLGEHRLLCGDSTNLKDVLRLMGNDKAALVATDPPYLVDYTGERPNDSGKGLDRPLPRNRHQGRGRVLPRGVRERARGARAEGRDLLLARAQTLRRHPADLARPRHPRPPADHLGQADAGVRPRLLALPARAVRDGMAAGRQAGARRRARQRLRVGVRLGRQGAGRRERAPYGKPVELFARPIKKHTHIGDIVFEPFSGSGSQLIAAERTGAGVVRSRL